MKDGAATYGHQQNRRPANLLILAMGIVLAVPMLGQNSGNSNEKQEKGSGKGVGFVLSDEADSRDVGLPIYPGAQRLKDDSDESSAVQMGLWGGSNGFKLVVLKLESGDPAQKIAEFYRKALARYGNVVDCSTSSTNHKRSDSGDQLECENDHAAAGGFAFKAGTKRKQHIVAVEPDGKRTRISLVYLWTRQSDSKPD